MHRRAAHHQHEWFILVRRHDSRPPTANDKLKTRPDSHTPACTSVYYRIISTRFASPFTDQPQQLPFDFRLDIKSNAPSTHCGLRRFSVINGLSLFDWSAAQAFCFLDSYFGISRKLRHCSRLTVNQHDDAAVIDPLYQSRQTMRSDEAFNELRFGGRSNYRRHSNDTIENWPVAHIILSFGANLWALSFFNYSISLDKLSLLRSWLRFCFRPCCGLRNSSGHSLFHQTPISLLQTNLDATSHLRWKFFFQMRFKARPISKTIIDSNLTIITGVTSVLSKGFMICGQIRHAFLPVWLSVVCPPRVFYDRWPIRVVQTTFDWFSGCSTTVRCRIPHQRYLIRRTQCRPAQTMSDGNFKEFITRNWQWREWRGNRGNRGKRKVMRSLKWKLSTD